MTITQGLITKQELSQDLVNEVENKINITDLDPKTTGGTSTAYTVTVSNPNISQLVVVPHLDCGANPTLSINGGTALTILKQDGSVISSGDIKGNKPLSLVRVGSNFFIRSYNVNTNNIKAKIIKQMFKLPLCRSSQGSSQLNSVVETVNYYFYIYYVSGTTPVYNLICINKSNVNDISVGYINSIPNMLPIEELDLVVIYSDFKLEIYNSNWELVGTISIGDRVGSILSSYYNITTKNLYVCFSNTSSSIYLMAINLNNISSISLIYNKLIVSSIDSTLTHAGFEIENEAMRFIYLASGSCVSRRYRLSDASIITSYTSPTNLAGLQSKLLFGDTYNVVVYANFNGINKFNIETNTLIATKTLQSIGTEISSFSPKLTLEFNSSSMNSYANLKKVDGKYLAAISSKVKNFGLPYPLQINHLFMFDINLNILGTENGYEFDQFKKINSLSNDTAFGFTLAQTEGTLYIFK